MDHALEFILCSTLNNSVTNQINNNNFISFQNESKYSHAQIKQSQNVEIYLVKSGWTELFLLTFYILKVSTIYFGVELVFTIWNFNNLCIERIINFSVFSF